ncbi:hypothetical protein SCARR_04324 [Pontiella sulfatireligans]|uniref:Dockerin domain-containing protein n=1 Tax=Pontiella sulfatireligans TaxID=2750658 RepID=A0A6C2UPM6_9BACT|nr:hypothetical protein SCARR_04324 [Pontiella sulfatireligans]
MLPLIWAGWTVSAEASLPECDCAAPAGCYYVDGSYTPSSEGWGVSRFSSVEDAVLAMVDGGTIHVASGIFTIPPMEVEQDIEVVGAGASFTVFQPLEPVTSNGWWRVQGGGLTLRDCMLSVASNQCEAAAVAIKSVGMFGMHQCALSLPAGCRAISTEQSVEADHNHWGGPLPEFGLLIDTNQVFFEPWFEDSALTKLAFSDGIADLRSSFAVSGGETLGVNTLILDEGITLDVQGGSLRMAELAMAASASIVVTGGEVVFQTSEGETTVAGSFTLYDSMGSMFIENDTEFSGDTLALVSHIVVSDGVTLRVSGSLILDGCAVDCATEGGSFDFVVADGADFKMSRTQMSGCGNLAVSNAVMEIQSCVFLDTPVDITAQAIGVRFFHNVMMDGAVLVDSGAGTVTEVDEWGNVADISTVKNMFSLDMSDENLPAGRTLDGEGLFIQPGDNFDLLLNLSGLNVPVSGCEALLGYNGSFFTNGILELVAPWEFNIAESWSFEAGDPLFGEIDSGVGLGMSAPREGTVADGAVAHVTMQAQAKEGDTVFYFRPQINELWDTRLASDTNGISGTYLVPFTMNSEAVTVDGTPPSVHGFDGFQDQYGVSMDVFDPLIQTLQGSVLITLEASDALSGLVDPNLVIQQRTDPEIQLSPTLLATSNWVVGTLWIWALPVTPTVPSGIYDVFAVVADRSGNTVTNAATLDIRTAEIEVNIDLQVTTGNSFEEPVSLTFLDVNFQELLVDERSLVFTDGQAAALLQDIPLETAFLRAKGATSLSRVQPVSFDANMQGLVDFSGEAALLCGDLNGDNAINISDYGIVSYYWLSSEPFADVNHDGAVNITDYGIIQFNWLQQGE